MLVNTIQKGIVIDHITAGQGAKIIEYLDIDTKVNTIAFIMNATSKRHGRKDIVKIENVIDIDMAVLGLIDHTATVNIIEHGKVVKKIVLALPNKVVNVIKCRNPRCVTSVEINAPHIFYLIDELNKEYRCEYCDDIVSMKEGTKNEIMH
jgi:aspartate carbamoyltransferase regulatory subunit